MKRAVGAHVLALVSMTCSGTCSPSDPDPTTMVVETVADPREGLYPLGDELPVWAAGSYFPRFPASSGLLVISVQTSIGNDFFPGSFDDSWRINNDVDDMMALTLVAMQGLINRHESRVYLNWQESNNYAAYWLNDAGEHVPLEFVDLEGQAAVEFLLERFAGVFEGAVIYDPSVPDTINLATMIAGVENRVMVASDQLALSGFPTFGSVVDLHDVVVSEGWVADVQSQTAIYQWAYDNLWPDLEHRMIGLISPGRLLRGSSTSRVCRGRWRWRHATTTSP